MQFHPSAGTLDFWVQAGFEPASDADIVMLEERLGGSAPASFVAFMKQYGNVRFSIDHENSFEGRYEDGRQPDRVFATLGFVARPSRALQWYENLQARGEAWDPDEGWIRLPPHLLPFASSRGEGRLLIEFGRPTERIFYLDLEQHDWDEGEARLALVASDMYELIDRLEPWKV